MASGSDVLEATLSRQEAAAAVFSALAHAEKAAMAAAEASGQLEHALQNAERQAGVPTPAGGWVSTLKNNNSPDGKLMHRVHACMANDSYTLQPTKLSLCLEWTLVAS